MSARLRYLGRRAARAILLLLLVSFFSFVLLQLTPGQFFDAMRLNPQVSAQTVDGLRAKYGLDEPLFIRYADWLRSVARGEMGISLAYNSPVAPLVAVRARNTLLLTTTVVLIAWAIAIPAGVWSAARRGGWLDRLAGLATSSLMAVPDLLIFLCLLFFAVKTGWLPSGGMASPGYEQMIFWAKVKDVALHLCLPVAGLVVVSLPWLVRHVRSATVEALDSPFILAARGHGIPRTRLHFRYVLPAAANPLISLFGLSVASLLSASLLVEVILGWPGLGPLLLEAILARDIYVVTAAVTFSTAFLVAGNLLADVLLLLSDPRIRAE